MAKTNISMSIDSTADLSDELYKKYDLEVVPFGINVGDEMFQDGVNITAEQIYEAVEQKKIMPKTCAVTEMEYMEIFERGIKKHGAHIHFSLSSGLSVSFNNAVRAASQLENCFVVDCKTLSSGIGIVAMLARDMADAGESPKTIYEKSLHNVGRVRVSFVLRSLKYLHKGGRCSGLKLLGANLLNLHPQIVLTQDGHMVQGKIFRGNFSAVVKNYADHILNSYPRARRDIVFVTHTDIEPELVNVIKDSLKEAGFTSIHETEAGCTITTHCGRSCIGILLYEEE